MPFEPSPQRRLIDIRHNIHLAQKFVREMDRAAFLTDDMAFYAVTRCLEIISEASRRPPDEMKQRHPEIPWADIAGAGNVYRHDYEDVQQARVWATVQNRPPELLAAVEQELARFDWARARPVGAARRAPRRRCSRLFGLYCRAPGGPATLRGDRPT
jgi:uncharacterized protein with HEPN domain